MDFLEFRFAFHAKDFQSSVRFYEETLGLRRTGGWDRADGKGALLSAGGTAVIEIYGAPEGKTYSGPAPLAINLALRLPDRGEVDQLYSRLLAQSASLDEPPQDRLWGHRSFLVYDPDGIPVHVYCEIPR